MKRRTILGIRDTTHPDTLIELNLFLIVLLSVEGVETNVVISHLSTNLFKQYKRRP